MPRIILGFMVTGFLAGCVGTITAPPPAPLVVTVAMAIDDNAVELAPYLLDGIAIWEGRAVFVEDSTAPQKIQCATWAMDTSAATANADGIAVDCLYFSGLSRESKNHLFAHEFGHIMGLAHVAGDVSIMYPVVSNTTALTDLDKAEFDSTRYLRPSGRLNP